MTSTETTVNPEPPYSSNAVRLSGRQWGAAGGLLLLAVFLIPAAWKWAEPFEPGPDYRVPYALSEDYWHFQRYCRLAAEEEETVLVIGDSVIWGEYVSPSGTLPHHLGERVEGRNFANLGVNGIHPAALAGLIRYYGRAVKHRDVIIQYNPLWMSSERHDLQTQKEFRFNHPHLVPQFSLRIPCYKDPNSERLGIVAERYLPLRQWANHLSVAYLDNESFPGWTLQNPYKTPLSALTLELPSPEATRHKNAAPWTERGIEPQTFPWVAAQASPEGGENRLGSLQWRLFRQGVETLLARGNRVFVVVGPFNEHMIAEKSRPAYENIKQAVAAWLDGQPLEYHVAEPLPSELYADASHPLSDGYALLAERLLDQESFCQFVGPGMKLAAKQ